MPRTSTNGNSKQSSGGKAHAPSRAGDGASAVANLFVLICVSFV
jgi:hypothetical protein